MDGYGKRILIIDDNEDILYLTGMALSNRGYNVYTACDGFEGLAHMKRRRYDAVLTDFHMPRLSGLQFIEMCRSMWPETPIILMSGDTWMTDRAALVEGTFGRVAKPFDLAQLLELVNRACRNSPHGEPVTRSRGDRPSGRRSSSLKERDTNLQATGAVPLTS